MAVSSPVTEEDAWTALRDSVPDLPARGAAGQIEILQGYDWYLPGDQLNF